MTFKQRRKTVNKYFYARKKNCRGKIPFMKNLMKEKTNFWMKQN